MARGGRVPAPNFEPQTYTRPTATPVGETVRAVQPRKTPGMQLAETLAEISPKLQQTIWAQHQQDVAQYEAEAEGRLNGMTVDEAKAAMQRGDLYPVNNPWYRAAVNKFYGIKLGEDFRLRAIQDFQSWDKNGNLDTFLQERMQGYSEQFQGDAFAQAGFNESFRQTRSTLQAAQFEFQNKQMQFQLDQANLHQSGVWADRYRASDGSPVELAGTINTMLETLNESARIGGWTNEEKNDHWFAMIQQEAQKGDYQLAEAMANSPRGDIPSLRSIPAWQGRVDSETHAARVMASNAIKAQATAAFTQAGMEGNLNLAGTAFADRLLPDGSTYTVDQQQKDAIQGIIDTVRADSRAKGESPAMTSAREIVTLESNGIRHPEMTTLLPASIDRMINAHITSDSVDPLAPDQATFALMMQVDSMSPGILGHYLTSDEQMKFFGAVRYATTTAGNGPDGRPMSFTEAVSNAQKIYANRWTSMDDPEIRKQVQGEVDSLVDKPWFSDYSSWVPGWFTSDEVFGGTTIREALMDGAAYYQGMGFNEPAEAVARAKADFLNSRVRVNGTWVPIPSAHLPQGMSAGEFSEIVEDQLDSLAEQYGEYAPELENATIIPQDNTYSSFLVVPRDGTAGIGGVILPSSDGSEHLAVIDLSTIIGNWNDRRQAAADEGDAAADAQAAIDAQPPAPPPVDYKLQQQLWGGDALTPETVVPQAAPTAAPPAATGVPLIQQIVPNQPPVSPLPAGTSGPPLIQQAPAVLGPPLIFQQ